MQVMNSKRSSRSYGRRKKLKTDGLLDPVPFFKEIYGWFTEGFDTADLKDAKVPLKELNNSR
jgi:hypothetical protein